MKQIAILGSTGSIGTNSLEVIARHPDKLRATYLTTNNRLDELVRQVERFKPRGVVIGNPAKAHEFRGRIDPSVEVLAGEEGLRTIVRRDDVDVVINSLVGFAGLTPTIEAIRHKKGIALANKETLVVGGSFITELLREYGVPLLPVDSEHSAIYQCLAGEASSSVKRIILTASGGPFHTTPREEMECASVEQALKHPNWKMGNKITIDSATMMNKGLEVIEARWFFHLLPRQIDVLVHPQSIIHSVVEFRDGSCKAQLGMPDMKVPILYALTYPDRYELETAPMDLAHLGSLTFFAPDREKFPALRLAYEALETGGTMPAALNAANEVAVQAFLEKKIPFGGIPKVIEHAMRKVPHNSHPELEHIYETDRAARTTAAEYLIHIS